MSGRRSLYLELNEAAFFFVGGGTLAGGAVSFMSRSSLSSLSIFHRYLAFCYVHLISGLMNGRVHSKAVSISVTHFKYVFTCLKRCDCVASFCEKFPFDIRHAAYLA